MSEQYRYPPNDPFLQSRQSNVFHQRHGKFLKLQFCHNFSEKLFV
ncbi:unnamed protein product [Staurois parvus]|uniref:Uncharacterized protein n=1 Tax=Staurois parvus TaxID=386267 RepID=A0ABN9HD73_9NEOB|nr:unnamed protein product [Staurois parvus]